MEAVRVSGSAMHEPQGTRTTLDATQVSEVQIAGLQRDFPAQQFKVWVPFEEAIVIWWR